MTPEQHEQLVCDERLKLASEWVQKLPVFPPNVECGMVKLRYDDGYAMRLNIVEKQMPAEDEKRLKRSRRVHQFRSIFAHTCVVLTVFLFFYARWKRDTEMYETVAALMLLAWITRPSE